MSRAMLVCGLLLGCAEGGTEEASSADSKSLDSVLKEHDELGKRLAAVPPGDREDCELHAGDCMVLVNERRGQLVNAFGLSACAAGSQQDDCLFEQLQKSGKQRELGEYVTYKSWCMKELLTCTNDAESKEKVKSVEARLQKRKQAIETSPQALEQWNAVEAARERVRYLRATLPPKAGEGVCEMAETAACQKEIEARSKAFDAELRPDQYAEKEAIESFSAIKRSEAACFAPELKCLSEALNPYGMFPESRKVLERNLASIGEREALASTATPEAEAECLADLEAQHAATIEAAFQAYSRDPVLYFRLRLEKAYLNLHQAQIACLTSKSKAPPKPAKPNVIELD